MDNQPVPYRPSFIDYAPEIDQLEADIRDRITQVQDSTGFVPNVFLAFAQRPNEFRAFFSYYDTLMTKSEGLSKAEREMIVVVTSSTNNCLYCVVAHGAVLRIYAKDPLVADEIAINYRMAGLTSRELAICEVAIKVAKAADEIDESDFGRLREAGLSDDEIWDVGAITAFFALSNRMAGFTHMEPNPEFYLMGRIPKTNR